MMDDGRWKMDDGRREKDYSTDRSLMNAGYQGTEPCAV
jgi:hypothetical protein